MHTSNHINGFLIILMFLLPACTTQQPLIQTGSATKPADRLDRMQADPHLDHVFAWIPRDRAKTASVAEALVHIELARAKEEVGTKLCGGGWLLSGHPVESFGPYPATAPVALGGYPAWYYHLSDEPGFTGCATVPTATLYQELGNRLPPWINVRAAALPASAASGTGLAATSTVH
jgi:hypothetical protein